VYEALLGRSGIRFAHSAVSSLTRNPIGRAAIVDEFSARVVPPLRRRRCATSCRPVARLRASPGVRHPVVCNRNGARAPSRESRAPACRDAPSSEPPSAAEKTTQTRLSERWSALPRTVPNRWSRGRTSRKVYSFRTGRRYQTDPDCQPAAAARSPRVHRGLPSLRPAPGRIGARSGTRDEAARREGFARELPARCRRGAAA